MGSNVEDIVKKFQKEEEEEEEKNDSKWIIN